ncbi:MAG TPA: DHH family phosphoesterase [Thermoplasmatales archaeon]|nr:DHH family phosphoesterase [Thermoplasmatales archaeon]
MEKLIIHHWDTDGICSAAILLRNLGGKAKTVTPQIGNYFLTDEEIKQYSQYKEIYIVDMALPENNVRHLASGARVTVFDHHVQTPLKEINHINPVAYGASQEDFPSATWVLKEHFHEDEDLLVVLGIVGDNEHKIKDNKGFYDIVQRFCKNQSIGFDELVRAVYLIDSNYKLGKKREVEKLPQTIGGMGIKEILTNGEWNSNLKTLDEEIERIVNDKDLMRRRDNTVIIDIDTQYNIISTVTRRIAWSTGENVVVINRGFFEDRDQIYVRTSKINLDSLIDKIRHLGYNAGGKKSVMGAIVPKERTEDVINSIVGFFEGKTW